MLALDPLALFALALPLALPSSAQPPGDDCLADGDTTKIQHDRPPLPDEPGAAWGRNPPTVHEDDATSPDDPMGDAEPGPDTNLPSGCAEVKNEGGELKGPDGTTQNGDLEGDCIEVKICWTYCYVETVTKTYYVLTATGFATITVRELVKVCDDVCSEPEEVCPCDEESAATSGEDRPPSAPGEPSVRRSPGAAPASTLDDRLGLLLVPRVPAVAYGLGPDDVARAAPGALAVRR